MADFESRFRIKKTYGLMSDDEKERIHLAALDVLEGTGVRVHSETARRALLDAGAERGSGGSDLRLPSGLVESLISKVPEKIVLAGRTKEFDLPVDGTHLYFTTDGCGVAVWDIESKSRRRSVLDDVRKTAVISDWLPYVSIYEPMVVAHDVPEKEHVVRGMAVAMDNTSKHLLTESTSTPEEARAQVEMASAVVGGSEELRRRHYISAMVCTISPLVLDGHATEAAMVWAENHVPIHITSMAASGLSGPVTLAGDLVVCHAETLALACAVQAHSPGAPVMYGAVLSSMDPKTGSYVSGSPESMLLCAGSVEMGKYVDFPISTGGLGAGAKTPGPQASVENTMSAAACGLVGGEVVNGLGVTDFSALLSYEQLMIDHEIAGMIIRLYKGVDVSDETLATDVIKKVGIGGSYLAQRHTMNHIRELYKPLLWEEIVPGLDKPEVDMLQVAKAKAESVLAKHVPVALDRPVKAEVDRIVASFGKG
ncbi:MAG: hypothetical protein QG582_1207 [Candidatus Thermoplasmatota archaeon]|nr:hypothetical protein [Candidatus Thermoplasmatota archaeon]